MAKRDPQRTEKLRIAVRYLLDRGELPAGSQSRLAEHFKVSRQRVHQIVVEERRRENHADHAN
jgi:DNA-directed RNA polymerase sigma subunit (sigma70/sigma32)